MSTVVQRSYPPQIGRGRPGMIADTTDEQTSAWTCETAAGIPYGRAVSKGTADKGAVIGGAAFVGISVVDITQDQVPLDPLNDGTYATVEVYPKDRNMGVCSRGHIYVTAQANVTAGDDVYYEQTGGTFSDSASGTAACGKVAFTSNPVADDTITINGTAWTFKDTGATGPQTNIRATLADTLAALVADLNASGDTNIDDLTYAAYPTGGAEELHYSADTVGTAGNSISVTTTVDGTTITAMAGGTASGTLITGAKWVTSALAGDIAIVSLGIQR